MKQFLIIVLIFVSLGSLKAQEENFEKAFYKNGALGLRDVMLSSPNTGNYDLKYYRFDINIDPDVRYIEGSVTPYFLVTKDNTSKIYFDFSSDLTVDSILYQGKKLQYEFTGDYELEVKLLNSLSKGKLDSLTIWYSGVPDDSGFGSFIQYTQHCDTTKSVIWTLSEPYGARDWWPTKQSLTDKIDSVDMNVTTPLGNRVGSNGVLVKVDTIGDKLVHHWKHRYPEPAYLIAISVTDYDQYVDWVPLSNGDSLMVLEYVYPCDLNRVKPQTKKISSIMNFYIEKFGDYPYDKEKYGHAQFGWGGGMEHSTMTFLSGFYHLLLSHELAHQWFGDKITCGSWQDIWLNEGFATYLEGLTYDFDRDPWAWVSWKTNNLRRALYSPNGSVYVYDTTSVANIFNGSLSYSKGAFLLHMLRWKMGDDNFFKALRSYINDPKLVYSYARTKDLQDHLEAQSGLDLDGFFADWLYGKGYPIYEIKWWYDGDGKLKLLINQSQTDNSVDFFEMPLPVLLQSESGEDTLVTLDNTYDGQIFDIDLDYKITQIVFDPDIWLCASVDNIEYLSTDNFIDNTGITVYPNPVQEDLNINFNNDYYVHNVSIFDTNGKKLKQIEVNSIRNSMKLEMPELKNTEYLLLKIVTDKGVFNKKIVVYP